MKKYAIALLSRVAMVLEFFISIMLAIGIILLCLRLAGSLVNIPDSAVFPNYEDLLATCFNLIIGVELIRMLYHHSPDTIFEVLVFAIARQVIIDHTSAVSSLIGVCAIAVLFATRKYLFYEFDISDKNIFRATTRVKTVNKVLGIHIPYEYGSTLNDLVTKKFSDENVELGVGACIYLSECGLRIAKMHGDKISRIEIIRAIH